MKTRMTGSFPRLLAFSNKKANTSTPADLFRSKDKAAIMNSRVRLQTNFLVENSAAGRRSFTFTCTQTQGHLRCCAITAAQKRIFGTCLHQHSKLCVHSRRDDGLFAHKGEFQEFHVPLEEEFLVVCIKLSNCACELADALILTKPFQITFINN